MSFLRTRLYNATNVCGYCSNRHSNVVSGFLYNSVGVIMALSDFIANRKKEIAGKVSLSTYNSIVESETFIDCRSCDYIRRDKDNVYYCARSGANHPLPAEVIPLGCSNGVEMDIPF